MVINNPDDNMVLAQIWPKTVCRIWADTMLLFGNILWLQMLLLSLTCTEPGVKMLNQKMLYL